MLEIRNLTKKYKGGKVAVDNLSLTVEAGDIFAFIGHNGAGKLKLEFSDCIINLSSAEKLSAIGTDKFLLHDALDVAATMREEINKE